MIKKTRVMDSKVKEVNRHKGYYNKYLIISGAFIGLAIALTYI